LGRVACPLRVCSQMNTPLPVGNPTMWLQSLPVTRARRGVKEIVVSILSVYCCMLEEKSHLWFHNKVTPKTAVQSRKTQLQRWARGPLCSMDPDAKVWGFDLM
jgi:hypothetical protein